MSRGRNILWYLLITCWSISAQLEKESAPINPIVDLQYTLHQGTFIESRKYYSFSNIRYAAPPVGELRFSPPVAPASNRTLNHGQNASVCAQGSPFWGNLMIKNLMGVGPEQLKKDEEELELLKKSLTTDTIHIYQPLDPRTSEDCLHLDVIVPEDIFNNNKSAPVLVWIHGGGYVSGDKTSAVNPNKLLAKAEENGESMIFVAINYRLGLFGWLSGSNFTSQNGLPNAGLYDQRFALDWIQRYIHLFGGDPSRVTVMGESAGGGSIIHHITAWGSEDPPPFQRAILQSPGFIPIAGQDQQEMNYELVISQAQSFISENITSIADLKSIDFKELAALNKVIVAQSAPYGTFTFGPVVDGNYVPDLPGKLISEGRYAKPLSVMTAHNSNEGYLFTLPYVTDPMIDSNIKLLFPDASNATKSHLIEKLWPAVYEGSSLYSNPVERASLAISEIAFTCAARYTALAYPNSSFAYSFAVPPGYHSYDVPYTFYNGEMGDINATVAETIQSLITNFVKYGNPNGPGVPKFPPYIPGSQMLVLSNSSINGVKVDTAANNRCAWLQNAPLAS
ncbi:Carboxylesterase patB [Erysiphe neolycopersici]|uniref:Carboxylic ester hydrolase n=1 Tax=Erysiphe neolycopersici TaxID=212602 RepID=A0A420I260_9PEZI|nr:Carboxylesterase patB [Erysiphe neolycopersici]